MNRIARGTGSVQALWRIGVLPGRQPGQVRRYFRHRLRAKTAEAETRTPHPTYRFRVPGCQQADFLEQRLLEGFGSRGRGIKRRKWQYAAPGHISLRRHWRLVRIVLDDRTGFPGEKPEERPQDVHLELGFIRRAQGSSHLERHPECARGVDLLCVFTDRADPGRGYTLRLRCDAVARQRRACSSVRRVSGSQPLRCPLSEASRPVALSRSCASGRSHP